MNGRLGSPARQVTTCPWRRTPTSPGPDLAQLPQPQHYQLLISPRKGKASIRRYLEGGHWAGQLWISSLPAFPDSILIISLWSSSRLGSKLILTLRKVLQTGRDSLPTLVPGSDLDKEDRLHTQAVAI